MKQREIKFRAWDVQEKCFALNHVVGNILYELQYNAKADVLETFKLMQYTGLKDKNGKEIYEGDIIQYKHYYACKRWWSTVTDIPEIEKQFEEAKQNNIEVSCKPVLFHRGGFCLSRSIQGDDIERGQKVESGSNGHADYEEKYWDFEVIGNIYENPELLKV